MPAEATMSVSVVMERRTSNSPWQDYAWRPIGLLPQVAHERGKLLSEGDDWAHFQVGTLQLELHPRATWLICRSRRRSFLSSCAGARARRKWRSSRST
jgi:hypothetical protein